MRVDESTNRAGKRAVGEACWGEVVDWGGVDLMLPVIGSDPC